MADHFGPVASRYAAFRPDYPDNLFEWLVEISPQHNLAWDCGAGSGQATAALAKHFKQVHGSDISAAQLDSAMQLPNVCYRVAPAEHSGLPDGFIDLVTVAQALHWFDLGSFYREVRRVLRPQGIIAVWGYNRLIIDNPEVQRKLEAFYDKEIGAYWPPERIHVETGYRDLPFPFQRIDAPQFLLQKEWTRDHLLGYLRSWSAVARFQAANGFDPVVAFAERIAHDWPEKIPLRISWPLFMHVGRVA